MVRYFSEYLILTPMNELLIEEMGKLTFGNEQLTAIELASCGN